MLLILGLLASLLLHPAPLSQAAEGCELYTDPQGIPHVRGAGEEEALACLGYLHGRDRAWQMDYFRRAYQGRLAELLGADSIKTDFLMRLLGLEERARDLHATLDPAFKSRLEAYSRGATRGMAEAVRNGAYEFKDFGYFPAPWKPEDTIGVMLIQSFDQTRRSFEDKIRSEKRREKFGAQAVELFRETGLPWDTAILKKGEYAPASSRKDADESLQERPSGLPAGAAALDSELFGPETAHGSNNWVLAPKLSRSGKALLANDPHLALKYPSFFYWAHLQGGELDAIGATVPGIPLVVSGANRQVAWGLTNSYLDVADVDYVSEDSLRGGERRRPLLWFRFWKLSLPMFFKSFQRTPQGWPVLPLPAPPGKALVLRWSGFELKAQDLETFLGLMKARDAVEMNSMLSRVGLPSWNFVFADTRGEIGYRSIGKTPRRAHEMPYGVPSREGLGDLSAWSYLSAEEMPAAMNPARGFVVTANNRQWPEDASSFAGRAQRSAFRAFRIEELLRATPRHDLESMGRVQCDAQAVEARFLLPPLLSRLKSQAPQLGAREREALAELERWDLMAKPECRACGVYRLWAMRIYEETGMDERALFRALTVKSFSDLGGSLDPLLRRAFSEAVERSGLRPWKELHRARFPHFAGKDYRERSSIPTLGDENSVNFAEGKWNGAYLHQDVGASQRLLVELSDPPRVRRILPGQALDVAEPSIDDPSGPWARWSRCETDEVSFPLDWARVRSERITL